VKSRLDLQASDLGLTALKNIAEPVRTLLTGGGPAGQTEAAGADCCGLAFIVETTFLSNILGVPPALPGRQ
jgi:hypothetical protein